MKFCNVNVKIEIKHFQKLEFKMTNEIGVKTIKINNNENMTDWK